MAERQTTEGRKRSSKAGNGAANTGLTAEERAAMRDRVKELKAARRGSKGGKEAGESEVLAKIAEMPERDRALAERLHALITDSAPELTPRTWYGMPAYAKDDQVLCFFQNAGKFKTRYATFGFSDKANLDQGSMWPISFALTELTPEVEERIRQLLHTAMSA